jgi:hypothetical protein
MLSRQTRWTQAADDRLVRWGLYKHQVVYFVKEEEEEETETWNILK